MIDRPMHGARLPLWYIPFAYALIAILLGLTLPRIEAKLFSGWYVGMSSSSAVALYSSVATGMITLTGIVFSLVFVMVQFSATAYSPRLVLWMSRDPLVSHAIGVFTATFLYALAALAWVDRDRSATVPLISAWLLIVLLLASIAVFVGLIQSLSRLQVNNTLAFTGDFARQVIEVMYPPLEPAKALPTASDSGLPPTTQRLVYHGPPRAIQSVNITALVALADGTDAVIEMISAVGDTLVEGTPILRVCGGQEKIRDLDLRKAIRTGVGRTFEQDPKYSLHILSDIAVRALSPAVNDPTTAVQALDQIEDLLLRLGSRRLEIGDVRNDSGVRRLLIPVPTWEDFLELAFSQIRSYGATSMQVTRRMKALLIDLADALPEERRSEILRQQKRLTTAIARAFVDIDDQIEASAEDREGFGATRRYSREAGADARAGRAVEAVPTRKATTPRS